MVDEQPLSISFPSLFAIVRSREAWVSDYWTWQGEEQGGNQDSLDVLMIWRWMMQRYF